MKIDTIVVEISKLVLKDDDYLVVKFPHDMDKASVEYLEHKLHEKFPKINFLLHSNDIELAVIHRVEQ